MKYISIIPLAGGFTIAANNILGIWPEAILSYTPFQSNDSLLLDYIKSKNITVPYINLDKTDGDYDNIDFVIGIPPCNVLSQCSSFTKEKRIEVCKDTWMIKSINYVLSNIKPTVYCFENAPGLYTNIGTFVRNNIIELAKKYNYAVTFYKTDTLLHGIPQHRPRTYVFLFKGSNAPIIERHNTKSLNIADYLKQIPKDATLQYTYMTSHWDISTYEITKFFINKYGNNWRDVLLGFKHHICSYNYLAENGLLNEFLEFLENLKDADPLVIRDTKHVINKTSIGKNFRLSHKVLCLDKDYIYAVIGEMMERNIHPTENRKMSIREYCHLMGLPHDYQIPNNKKYFAKITQNVPVKTSEDMIKEIIEIINGNKKVSNERVLMIDNTRIEKVKTKSLF